MSTLELRGLTKRFGEIEALNAIDLTVDQGDFCVLLGPSGCGKSTALRCIAGLETITDGDVIINGDRVNEKTPKERGIAMVFQTYALYPHMTVRENLAFPLKMSKMPKDEMEKRVRDAASLLRIEPMLERRPRELSGGQRQRVAIGRAIVREPTLFLFDEPLSNLDAKLRNDMRLEIAALHRRLEATVIYVTHDQVEAMTLGKTIVVMNDGRIEQVGTPDEVYQRPATPFVAGFVGMPAMNFITGEIRNDAFEGNGFEIPVSVDHEGETLLGVRPEDINLGGDHGEGEVEIIENLGADRYAYLKETDTRKRWAVRLNADESVDVGQAVNLSFNVERLHLYADNRRLDVTSSS
ncbi:MAG: sn-glycerol-3-phosphate ABC transporter ATP-binding protein UgpC [candidate division Zixibacteria bacterium]|nr:sn-glycerol-3-phosphate ABC transporter ATP-binding protein UgpC [candidate division Zixibacteria bacterium]